MPQKNSMDPEQLIVLYSKYSPQCTRIVELYNSHPSNLDYLRLICVDNVNLREAILNATNIRVRTVPCVIFVYPGGRVEKFEGANVSDWIIRMMSKNAPTEHTPLVPSSQQEVEILPSSSDPPKQQDVTMLEDVVDDEEETIPAIRPKNNKTISDIAADMAASRSQFDREELDMRRIRNT